MLPKYLRFVKRLERSSFALIVLIIASFPTSAPSAEPIFEAIASAVVQVDATIIPGARTARSLGLVRGGSGVVIAEDGLILTIGYLIMESSRLEVTAHTGKTVPADFVAYDHRTGFGLLRAREDLGVKPLKLGDPTGLKPGAPLLILSTGQFGGVTPARMVSRRPFVGHWEYLLDNAIYTMPPHRAFGGAALVDLNGRLVGIGSLLVGDALTPNSQSPGNMFVPVDLLKPILSQMVNTGRSGRKPRPWLGVYAAESNGRVLVNSIAAGGPGAEAGLSVGDIIIGVQGRRVAGLADLFRKVWSQGDAGADVTLDILPFGAQNLEIKKVIIRSRDRSGWLKISDNKSGVIPRVLHGGCQRGPGCKRP